MAYTPVSCVKAGEVHIRCCLKQPFVDFTVYPLYEPNFGRVLRDNATGTFLSYASYIDNGTDQSFFTDSSDPDEGNNGGYYTGSKFMTYSLSGTDWLVGYVNHAYSDADDLTAPALTSVNLGNGGTAPISASAPHGPTAFGLFGPSEAGGDRISWLEGRTTETHFLTATTAALSRKQAFEIEAGESFRVLTANTNGWIKDGDGNFWMVSRVGVTGPSYNLPPYKLLLIRWKPTTVGDPFDYEKFEITFDDDAINDSIEQYGTASTVTGGKFQITVVDTDAFAGVRRFELSQDCTEYTEYVLTGSAAVEDMMSSNIPTITRTAGGVVRVIGYGFESNDWGAGTYDLTCHGKQGHVFAQRIRRGITDGTTDNRLLADDTDTLGWSDDDDILWKDES